MCAAPSGAAVRAGVEIVIGNMCLRQTNQKKVCLMRGWLGALAWVGGWYLFKLQNTTGEDTTADASTSLTDALGSLAFCLTQSRPVLISL